MNSYKKLFQNSAVIAVGRLGSSLISFLLVPLYTYYLSSAEYGTIDLVITTVAMLLPIISLHLFDGVLRFVMDEEVDDTKVISSAFVIIFFSFLFAICIYFIINHFTQNQLINTFVLLLLIVQIIERLLGEYSRGKGQIKTFALNGIIISLSMGFFSVILVVLMKKGIQGYLISTILSFISGIIFMIYRTKIYRYIQVSNFDLIFSKSLIKYSVPIIPNSLMWWLINASSRYFISFFIGVNANGLFAVSSKIPAIINISTQIFNQAWQLSAIEEYKNENKSKFYSTVFGYLATFLFLGVSFIIIFIKLLFSIVFSNDYFEAWVAVPFLLLGAIFSSFSSFLGTNYLASKQTIGVFKTSIYGGVVSFILNYFLIFKLGVIGAGISSMCSFLFMWLIRVRDTKRFVRIDIPWVNLISNMLIIVLQIIVLFLQKSMHFEIIVNSLLFLVLLMLNYRSIQKIFTVLLERIFYKK